MNTAATRIVAVPPLLTALRTVLAAGGWSNLLLALCWLLALLLPLLEIGQRKAVPLALVLCACLVMFWAMLAGARLVGTRLLAARLQLPHAGAQAARQALLMVALGALVPATLLALSGGPAMALGLPALLAALLLGVFWVTMPPWLMWLLMAGGYGLNQVLAGPADSSAAQPLLLCFSAGLAVAVAGFCWRMLRRPATRTWATPIAQLLANGQLTPSSSGQADAGASLFAPATPVSTPLREHPDQALAIALGPGFGRTGLRGVLTTQLPVLAVAALWLFLFNDADGAPVAWGFAPLMVVSVALPPIMRLHTLARVPALGLHEPALLPGLPRRPAEALATLLMGQMLLRALPALLVMAITLALLGAGRPQLLLLLWSAAGSLLWLHAASLAALQHPLARPALLLLLVLLPISLFATLLQPAPPSWLLPLWSLVLLAGALASALAGLRLRRRPHPWLQN